VQELCRHRYRTGMLTSSHFTFSRANRNPRRKRSIWTEWSVRIHQQKGLAVFLTDGQPVISVDTKKKELVQFSECGPEWDPKAHPKRSMYMTSLIPS